MCGRPGGRQETEKVKWQMVVDLIATGCCFAEWVVLCRPNASSWLFPRFRQLRWGVFNFNKGNGLWVWVNKKLSEDIF